MFIFYQEFMSSCFVLFSFLDQRWNEIKLVFYPLWKAVDGGGYAQGGAWRRGIFKEAESGNVASLTFTISKCLERAKAKLMEFSDSVK